MALQLARLPDDQQREGQYRRGDQLPGADPEYLSDQQILEVLSRVHVVAHQQDAAAGGKHEGQADAGFLHLIHALFDPGKQRRAA